MINDKGETIKQVSLWYLLFCKITTEEIMIREGRKTKWFPKGSQIFVCGLFLFIFTKICIFVSVEYGREQRRNTAVPD